jgi:alpha-glucosidase
MRGIVFTAFLLPSFAAAFCQAPSVVQNLPNGLEARQGVRLLSITALTDHILRVYKQFAAEHISGFWNDMNEPAVFTYPSKTMPDATQHRIDEPGFQKRTASHLEIHNVYGLENTRATYEGVLQLNPQERLFVLTRASYAGGQRYAATWTGDNSSTWNHLRETTSQLLNLGISGFALAGADVGGFAGSPSPDLLTKWFEVAAFQPIDRDHAAKGTRAREPWVDGPDLESIRRRFIEERYRLMPYLYTTVE